MTLKERAFEELFDVPRSVVYVRNIQDFRDVALAVEATEMHLETSNQTIRQRHGKLHWAWGNLTRQRERIKNKLTWPIRPCPELKIGRLQLSD